jgi:hypothetical protein
MSPGLWFLGYILNTMTDITSMVLTYYYGIFSHDVDKREAAQRLLNAEVVAVLYSWFFGWRQLRFMLPSVEVDPLTGSAWEVELVAFVSAGFIPLTLAVVGYAQSLQVADVDVKPQDVKPTVKSSAVKPQAVRKPKRQASSVKRQASGDKKARMDRLVQVFSQDPGLPITEAAEQVGRSRTTVYSYLEELEAEGRVRRNGEGVKVIGG